jgi:hypothetical protein
MKWVLIYWLTGTIWSGVIQTDHVGDFPTEKACYAKLDDLRRAEQGNRGVWGTCFDLNGPLR